MSEAEETGGVQALETWAGEAVARARALMPTPDTVARPSRAHDESIAELGSLSGLLDHDPPLRTTVTAWLGGVLTLRHAAGGGTPEDRERAHGLLRDVRDPATRTGAAASAEDRRWAALFLLTHALPLQEMKGGLAPEPDATAFFDLMMRDGFDGMNRLAAEVRELMADAVELPLPPEQLAQFRQVLDFGERPSADGIGDLLGAMIPDDGSPATDHLRQMVTDAMTRMTGGGDKPGTGPARAPSDAAGTESPSLPWTPDEFRRMIAAWQAVNTTSVDFVDHAGGGDPAAMNQQLGRLREAFDGMPEGLGVKKDALEGMMALLLSMSEGAGGTLQDQAVGFANNQKVTDYMRQHAKSSIPMAEGFAVMADVMDLMTEARIAGQNQDAERLRELLPEAEALTDAVPDGNDFRFAVLMARGAVRLMLGRLTLDRELLAAALDDVEAGKAAGAECSLPFADEAFLGLFPEADVAFTRAWLAGDTSAVPDREVPPADTPADRLHTAANRLGLRFSATDDPEDLDAVITTLERLREHIREGRAPRVAAESLWNLADGYRARWHRTRQRADADAAIDTVNEALATLAADVLLQNGTEHRLTTARTGASLAARAALWAAVHERVDDAVAALETGRALVLQAAATSRTVPELLEERGHPDLAAAWRSSGAADGTELPAELPSTLRRQALEALGYRQRGGLLGTPTLRELADGVGEAGADALIYLVPGTGGEAPGMVLAVGPEIGIGVGALPMLSETGSGPLERYLDAAAALSKDGPGKKQAWEAALSELCDWAHEVFEPVLGGLKEHLPDGTMERRAPRVVLVPCGRLGVVPWHAARFPEGSPYDYLCRALVISYAASGSQFLRTVKLAPRDPIAAPALVVDPNAGLLFAELEVLALREAFYPGARLYGDFGSLPPGSVPAGTPDQLLSLLAQDHSMVHLATHAMAGPRPTESALHLAPPDPDDATNEHGRLTVTRLLDRPQPAGQDAADGPLIVLSACETDLSNRDHDEALTLTTAFVSGGARDVVGSRWAAKDGASSLMMTVFHHHLRAGLSPVDALRAAQLWMLDPDRRDPGCLGDDLRADAGRPDLQRPELWAAFIHQGHPGQGKKEAV
ncbi:CHAT domain-containing protein [Streptomyces sp. NPDC046716]|uniref:CHAT domain-containing protein n=1 Tax=Streptomyces sp. NPDC046716 TaxID=3157093 RepID=UPI0033F85F33